MTIPSEANANYEKWLAFWDRLPIWLILFVLLMSHKWGIDISGGEAHYLSYAKHYMDPEWIPGSFTFSEEPGSRMLFQLVFGSLSRYFDFITLVGLTRLFNFLLYAIVLGNLVKFLGIPNWLTFVIFEIYLVAMQCFFGSEWIFISFEPKTMAYVCLFAGLLSWMKGAWRTTAWWMTMGTYFHFLVGGWFMLTLAILSLGQHRGQKAIRMILWYAFGISPLLLYIYSVIANVPPEENGLRANWIYVYYRLPHHLGLFKTMDYFRDTHLTGVLWTFIWWVIIWWKRGLWRASRPWHLLRQVHSLMGLMIMLFVGIAWVDAAFLNHSGGLLLKSYPFRQDALFKFFTFFLVAYWGYKLLQEKNWLHFVTPVPFLLLILTIAQTNNNIGRNRRFLDRPEYFKMTNWISENTPVKSTLIPYHVPENERITLGLFTDRDPWVEWKFVPAGTDKIYTWYLRQMQLDTFQQTGKVSPIAESVQDGIPLIVTRDVDLPDTTQLQRIYKNAAFKVWSCHPVSSTPDRPVNN